MSPNSLTAVTTINVHVQPEPALEKRVRRVFSTKYKLSVLPQADACKHGELGVLLRREKLYSSQLARWRREFSQDGVEGLAKSKPSVMSSKTFEQKRIEYLAKENARLLKQLAVNESCILRQKKPWG